MTGTGQALVEAFAEGVVSQQVFVRRAAYLMAEAGAYIRAAKAAQHADWYCSLPWYRQWWAMVTGR